MSSQEPEKKNSPTVGFLPPGLSQILKEKEKIVVFCLRPPSIKREIRKLHMVVHVKETAKKNVPKSVMQVQSYCFTKSIFFLFFFMFSLHLKLPNQTVWFFGGDGGIFV